jgi:hypothetical protein
MPYAQKIIDFNTQLNFDNSKLPAGIGIMSPFANVKIRDIATQFYNKYYNDDAPRHMILGINPGRLGSGFTGIPFTDTKRLQSVCHIPYSGPETHEPSSDFVYQVIAAFGGPEAFYRKIYIGSVCPLGFVKIDDKGREINYNYYDSKQLMDTMYDFMLDGIKKQIAMGMATDVCFCFGTGKNKAFLDKLNHDHQLFGKIIPLEHPRFIMQYKSKSKQAYINKYLEAFAGL